MEDRFARYFRGTVEYPGVDLLDGLSLGTLYQYVPSDFLGWAKIFVRPVASWVLERYRRYDRDRVTAVVSGAGAHGWIKWQDIDDDVVTLARVDGRAGQWMLLWFDCDTSDCSIGIFSTVDDGATIAAHIEEDLRRGCHAERSGVERDHWECLSGVFRHDEIGPRLSV